MRIAPRLLATSKAAVGIICLAVFCYSAWSHKRQLIELIGFHPADILFGLAIGIAALTIIAGWTDGIATRQLAQSAAVQDWISRLVLRAPLTIFLPLLLLNALLLILALGLVRANEVMGKRDQSAVAATTIMVSGTPVAQISLGKIRHIQRDSGFAFIYPLPSLVPFRARADSLGNLTYAATVVLENSRPIGPAHAPHDTIRQTGLGALSHWDTGWTKPSNVYFSATDNTSPLANGRTYGVEYTIDVHPAFAFLIIVASLPLYMRTYIRLSGVFRKLPISPTQKSSYLCACGVFCAALGFFILPLFAYWETGKTTYSVIGGLLPWSDGSDWLHGTHYLLHERKLFWWTARRPISAAFMSFLAFLSGENLQAMLFLRTLLTGIASLLVAAEIWRRYGASAGISACAILLAFVGPFTPTTFTESLGLAFGATGVAMMWQAISKDQPWRFAGGLLLLTLALSVRPGPILVLPSLTLWAGFKFRTQSGTVISRLVLMSSAVAAALIVTFLWNTLYGTGESFAGANYAFTFYGLAFGGKSWQQFIIDYPGAESLSEAGQSALAYEAAFAEVLHHPAALFIGLWSFSKLYLSHLYVYIELPVFRVTCLILASLGVVVAGYQARRDLHLSFLLWAVAGIVLSAPFVFWEADAYRAFIPTAPFEAVVVSVGLAELTRAAQLQLGSPYCAEPSVTGWHSGAIITMMTTVLAGFLVLSSTIAPVAALALYTTPRFFNVSCKGNLVPAIIHLGKSSPFISVVPNNDNTTHAPKITYRDFHVDPNFADVEIKEALRETAPGYLLIHGYDLTPGVKLSITRVRWMIAAASRLPKSGEYYAVCGRVKRFPVGQENYAITFVEDAQKVMPMND
jgi:hypothetical protein